MNVIISKEIKAYILHENHYQDVQSFNVHQRDTDLGEHITVTQVRCRE